MRNGFKIIKAIFVTLLFAIPLLLFVLRYNSITLMNNLCVYVYITIYIGIAAIYTIMRKDKDISKVVFILVGIYSIIILLNHTGTFEIKKEKNKDTIIAELFDDNPLAGSPNEADVKFYKQIWFFFKKDLNAPVFHGIYDIRWEDDYILITDNAAKYFIESYQMHEKNIYKGLNFEVVSGYIKINLNKT